MIYSNIFVVFNGEVLAEAISVETTLQRANSPVFSITDQFVGTSPGPLLRSVTIKNAISHNGSEIPFERMMVNGESVEIALFEGVLGRSCITKGVITNVSRSGAVGQNSSVSFSFIGTGEPFLAVDAH